MLLVCATTSLGGAPVPAEKPNVLVVLSYHVGMEWEDEVVAGLAASLGDRAEIVLLQLDVKRFPLRGREAAMEANLASKAAMCRPAVVIAIDDFAYEFVRQRRALLPPAAPLIFGGVNFLAGEPPARTGGVVEAIDIGGTLALARALFPENRRLVVVNDATETGLANDAALHQALALHGEGWRALRLGLGTFGETEAALAGLDPRRDVVLLLSWNLDAAGVARTYDEAVAAARAVCPAPLFGVWSFYFGHGLVGGALLDGTVHGREVGELAALALAGGPDAQIPVVPRCRTEQRVDARELARFGIDRARVPPQVQIRFVDVPFWREHLREVLFIAGVILLQAVTIAWLLWVRRRERRAERLLRASEANLRHTLDSIGDAVVVVDPASRIVRMNPVAERLTGRTAADATGRPLAEVMRLRADGDGAPLHDPVAQALARNGTPHLPGRAVLERPDGAVQILEYSAAPMRNGDGGLRGAVLALRDITVQQRTEAQLRQAQKTEALGRLVGGVAHDFNNLLLVIRGSVELAGQAGTDAAEMAEFLREIDQAAQRAAELTRQLLAFGRQQKLQVRPVDLAALLDGMLKMIRRVLTAKVAVELRGPVSGCWANVDAGQIEQVVMNLCVNARDAMPEGGQITLEVDRVQFGEADLAAYPSARPGTYHVLVVTDSGVGMDAETQRRIFEPFFSTKPVGRGTGLGLSVVQGIVQQHDGMVGVYSEPGHGTTFRIYLPAIPAPTGERDPAAPAGPVFAADVGAGVTVLLAEDDPAVRRVACGVLRSHSYQVLEVSDGEEACTVAATHTGPIDIAVLDVVMPRMSGPEAARRLQRMRPGLPILLCSGYPGAMPKETALPADWQWLAKPYPVAALLARLQALRASPPSGATGGS